MRRSFVFPAVLLLSATGFAGTRFVNAASTNAFDDGTSWDHAFRGSNGLRKALEVAVAGDEIWVAAGTYLPTRTEDRTQSLLLTDNVAVYGGFAGGETSVDDRDPATHETILSGDLAGDDASAQYGENSLCVLRMGSAVLDGCTISGGNADGAGSTGLGAGIQAVDSWVEPIVRRCVIRENRCAGSGAGVYLDGQRGTFQECRFVENVAGGSGAAVYGRELFGVQFEECRFEGNVAQDGGAVATYHGGLAYFDDCRFEGNIAAGTGGAASISDTYDGVFTRCIFMSNSAPLGGALHLSQGTSDLTTFYQCLVAGNSSTWGTIDVNGAVSGINVYGSTIAANTGGGLLLGIANEAHLTGTILYANGSSTTSNMTVRYSCTDFLLPGTGNIAADPQFVDAAGGNFRLQPTSPCIDAVESFDAIIGYDLDRTSRREDVATVPDSAPGHAPMLDMGAYETPGGLFTLACAGDSRLTRDCPCGTVSIEGSGCLHSSSPGNLWGGTLVAYGTAQPDTVGVRAAGMRSNAACILLQGNAIDGTGFVLGDGLRCIGGALKRMYSGTAVNGNAAFPAIGQPSISARSAALGDPILPGTRRHYQVWYRDPNPTFCPPPVGGTTNLTSAITMYW